MLVLARPGNAEITRCLTYAGVLDYRSCEQQMTSLDYPDSVILFDVGLYKWPLCGSCL